MCIRDSVQGAQQAVEANTRARGKSKYDHELILRALGGKENIESLDNCITRLRLVVKDMGLIDCLLYTSITYPVCRPVLDMFNDVTQPFSGSSLFRRHVPISEYNTAACSPPLSEPTKSQFFRPTATPRKAFSAMLLSISTQPLLQYTFRPSHCFSRYANAFAVSE